MSTAAEHDSLPAALLARASSMPTRVALRKKELGRWREYSWSEYATRAARVGMGLRTLGVERGDRVAIVSENRPAWVLTDLAVQGIGSHSVGVDPARSAEETGAVLRHANAVVVVAEDEEQLDKVLAVRASLPKLRAIVVVDQRGVNDLDDSMVMTFAELEGRGVATEAGFAAEVAQLGRDDVALVVYTSGASGPPTADTLSHASLLEAASNAGVEPGDGDGVEVLSYLPLCSRSERLISVVDGICSGYVVNFGEGGDSFPQDMREVQPTLFLGAPGVWEKMFAGATSRMSDAGSVARAAFRFWTRRGRRIAERRRAGSFGGFDRLAYAVGWLVMYRPLRDKLGLRRTSSALADAGPISPEAVEFFWSIGVLVRGSDAGQLGAAR